jgi:hypothetical protein
VAFLSAAPARTADAAIVFGQLDDFENGTTMGWAEGGSTPNEPAAELSGGPQGAGDAYLRNLSEGFGAGSKQAMLNFSQWTGNYNAAGVNRIDAWVANFGPDPLRLRVNIFSPTSQFSSTDGIDLAPDGIWRRVHFDLTKSTLVSGSGTVAAALSNVTQLNLISAPNPVPRSFLVPPVNATLGVDDLRAMRPEGDANFDGFVNGADFALVRANLGKRGGGRTWEQGDFDFDGRVTARDIALLRRNLNASAGAAAAGVTVVPEPAALMVLLPGLLLLVALPRRRRQAVPATA